MKDDKETIQNFIKNWLLFNDDIYEKRGINTANLKKLEQSFSDIKLLVSQKKSVPLEVTSIFIDLYSSIESLAYLYDEDKKQKIMETADYLASLARDVCMVDN